MVDAIAYRSGAFHPRKANADILRRVTQLLLLTHLHFHEWECMFQPEVLHYSITFIASMALVVDKTYLKPKTTMRMKAYVYIDRSLFHFDCIILLFIKCHKMLQPNHRTG